MKAYNKVIGYLKPQHDADGIAFFKLHKAFTLRFIWMTSILCNWYNILLYKNYF